MMAGSSARHDYKLRFWVGDDRDGAAACSGARENYDVPHAPPDNGLFTGRPNATRRRAIDHRSHNSSRRRFHADRPAETSARRAQVAR